MGHTYQHTRHAKKAQDVVRSGAIREVALGSALFASMVTAHYQGNPEEYRVVLNFPITGPAGDTYSDPALSGGGQAWAQMALLADMFFRVTGLSGKRVFTRMENLDLGVDAVDAMSLSFDNGALGTAGSTGQLKPGQSQQQQLRYYGTEGYLLQELIQGKLTIVSNHGRVEEVPDAGPDELYPAGAPVQALIDMCSGATCRSTRPPHLSRRLNFSRLPIAP